MIGAIEFCIAVIAIGLISFCGGCLYRMAKEIKHNKKA